MSSNPIRQATGQELEPPKTVEEVVQRNRAKLAAALPEGVSVERFERVAIVAIEENPELVACTRGSVMTAVLRCCQLNLEPNTPLGHIYIVPFNRSEKKGGGKVAVVIVGYKGFQLLAYRADDILSEAEVVREGDHFHYELGLNRALEHNPLEDEAKRGDVTHVYACARFPDGRTVFEVMTIAQVDSVMARVKGGGSYGPWKDDREQMQKKTAIRRLARTKLPLDPEKAGPALAAAVDGVEPNPRTLPIAGGEAPLFGDGATPAALPEPAATMEEPEAVNGSGTAAEAEEAPTPPAEPERAATAAPAAQAAPKTGSEHWSKVVIVDTETGQLVPVADDLDWKSEAVQEAAFEALKASILDEPPRGKAFLKANARLLGSFPESRKAALRHVVQSAAATAAPAKAEPAVPPPEGDDGDQAWINGL